MTGLFRKFAPGSIGTTNTGGSSSPFKSKKSDKDGELDNEFTPLQKMLMHMGPVRVDGSDKFFGMENFGNTCYCNSIIQALYYSIPFREQMLEYPPVAPSDVSDDQVYKSVMPSMRAAVSNGNTAPQQKARFLSTAEALKARAALNSGPTGAVPIGQRIEDKPDSPEYKKKRAIATGPILELTTENSNTYGMEEDPFTALKDIFMSLVSSPSRTGVVSPQNFLDVFKRINDMFRAAMHQDAHEFYGLVLNHVITAISEHERREKKYQYQSREHNLGHSTPKSLGMMPTLDMPQPGTPGTGWLHKIFEGVMTSETRCLTCETASQRDETFLDLSIDLENHSSVTSCLQKFSAEEMLRETNKFHCDQCGSLQEAEKRMKIKKLPQILTLHLKRFKYTDDLQRLQKLFDRVVYPYHLRMFNTTADAEDPDRLYELYAVVVHIGANAFHGHYVSVIKTKDRGWLLFDDEMVEPVDNHYVKNFFGDKPGQACAYLLFYQETTVEAMRKEQEAEGLAEVALATQEASIAPMPNGTHPSSVSKAVSVPGTPLEDRTGFVSLDHTPLPSAATGSPLPVREPTIHHSPPRYSAETSPVPVSKEEKDRGKKEAKEAEKAKKAVEKERTKEQEKRRKDFQNHQKEYDRSQLEESKRGIALSKQILADGEELRKREALAADEKRHESNGVSNEAVSGKDEKEKEKEKKFGLGSLSRNGKGSKSMTRKSFGFLTGRNGHSGAPAGPKENDEMNGHRECALNGDERSHASGFNGEYTSALHSIERGGKGKKERFSFSGLGRKKSSQLLSS